MSNHDIKTSIEIVAPPARVWTLLTDFAGMPDWNPFIKEISGDLKSGSRLSVLIAPPGKSAMRFRPTITAIRPEHELRWVGHLFLPGVFDGEHYFLLESIHGDRTRFTQGEKFSGFLVSLLVGTLFATKAGFHLMNVALKRQAEGVEGMAM